MIFQRLKLYVVGFVIIVIGIIQPLQAQNVVQTLAENEQTTEFAKALQQANLDEKLNKTGPFTLFAPSNSAFSDLADWQKRNEELLLNHIFMGMATERSLRVMSNVTFLSGKTIPLKKTSNGELLINANRLQESNIKASNGVIHIIDGVIK